MRWIPVLVLIALAITAWANDFVMLQGERTIYTAGCDQGVWEGRRCTGKLVAGDRYRFRALKPHKEVFFWVAGSSEPAGRFTDCDIQSATDWVCKHSADVSRSITAQMSQGRALPDTGGKTRPFHSVSKLHWMMLRYGWPYSSTAEGP